jgi:hypothetical protein
MEIMMFEEYFYVYTQWGKSHLNITTGAVWGVEWNKQLSEVHMGDAATHDISTIHIFICRQWSKGHGLHKKIGNLFDHIIKSIQKIPILTFGGFKSLIDGTCGPYGGPINAPIEEQHHKHGNIK